MSVVTTYPWARPKVWNTGSAAERFRLNQKKIKTRATSNKPQAIKKTQLNNRINLERNNMSFDNTIKLLKKQDDVLVDVIQWLDEKNFSNTEIRSKVDVILNHSRKLHEGSEMELTKIKLISPNYAYVKKGS